MLKNNGQGMTNGTRFCYCVMALNVLLLGAAVAISWLVRLPDDALPVKIVAGIDAAGQVRGLVSELLLPVRELAAGTATSAEQIVALRSQVAYHRQLCQRLEAVIPTVERSWVPLGEAETLLRDCRELLSLADQSTPSGPVAAEQAASADSLETDPNRTGLTPEAAAALQARADQLQRGAEQLRQHVEQAAIVASAVQPTWLGYHAYDLALAALGAACLVSLAGLWEMNRRLRTAPTSALEIEAKLMAKTNRDRAVAFCHERSANLLRLANAFVDAPSK